MVGIYEINLLSFLEGHVQKLVNYWDILTHLKGCVDNFLFCSCADLEEVGEGVPTPPLKNHKDEGFLSNTGPDSL